MAAHLDGQLVRRVDLFADARGRGEPRHAVQVVQGDHQKLTRVAALLRLVLEHHRHQIVQLGGGGGDAGVCGGLPWG